MMHNHRPMCITQFYPATMLNMMNFWFATWIGIIKNNNNNNNNNNNKYKENQLESRNMFQK